MHYEFRLSSGELCLIDDADKALVLGYKWRRHHSGYVYRQEGGTKKRKHFILSRVIMNAQPCEQVDHRDGNRLNNQRYNLRIATSRTQQFNKTKNKGKSRFKGVSKTSDGNRWRAYLSRDGFSTHIGCYATEEEAAQAYIKALCEYHGTTLEEWRREHPFCGL